jgi:hypothetical protein
MTEFTDYSQITLMIADAIGKTGTYLNEDQFLIMSGAVSVWLEKKYQEGYEDGVNSAR